MALSDEAGMRSLTGLKTSGDAQDRIGISL